MTDETARILQTVAACRSFSKAAEKLSVSQPAISAQVRSAEKEMNIRIFDRTVHPLALTPEGRELLDYLKQREVLERRFREKIRSMGSLGQGILRIGGASAFNMVYLPKAVKVFSERYPGIDIRIVDGTVPQLRQMVLDGDLDLFISSPTSQRGGLHFENLAETKIYFCVPPKAQLSRELKQAEIPFSRLDSPEAHPEVRLDQFADLPIIRLTKEKNLGHMLDELIARDAYNRPIRITADQTATSYMLTLKGVGASLMSGIDIRNIPVKEHPHFFMLSNQICRRMMSIAWKEDGTLPAAAKEFANVLKQTMETA